MRAKAHFILVVQIAKPKIGRITHLQPYNPKYGVVRTHSDVAKFDTVAD